MSETHNYRSRCDESPHDRDNIKLRLLIQGRYAGVLIGRGGENFKRLREEYNVRITGLSTHATERVLQLDGPRAECLAIVMGLIPQIPQSPYACSHNSPLCEFELNILAHTESVGLLIGKAGSTMKEITKQTGTKLKVYPKCLPNSNERVVSLGADDETSLIGGLATVLNYLEKDTLRRFTNYFHPGKQNSVLLSNSCDPGGVSGQVRSMNQAAPAENSIAALLITKRDQKKRNKDNDCLDDFGSVRTVSILQLNNDMCGAIIGKGGLSYDSNFPFRW